MGKLFAAAAALIVLLTVGAILLVHRFTEPLPPGPTGSGSVAAPIDRSAENPPEPYQADPAASGMPMNDALGGQVPTQPPPGPAAIAPPTESDETEQPPPSNRRRTRVPKLDREARGRQPEE